MKQFSIFFLLLLNVVLAHAQVGDHRSELAVGAGGGLVMSTIGFLPEVPQKQHMGFFGGIAIRYTSEKYFSSICALHAELNMAQMGWTEELLTPTDEPVINTVTGLAEEYQRDITYLQIPVFARLGWGRERRGMQFFFQAGPQLGIYLNEKTKSNFDFEQRNTAQRTSSTVRQDTMSVEQRFDYGITAGLGVEFSHPKIGHFLVEGRYYYGLGDIYGNSKRDFFGRSNFGSIYVKFTYLFDLKKTANKDIK